MIPKETKEIQLLPPLLNRGLRMLLYMEINKSVVIRDGEDFSGAEGGGKVRDKRSGPVTKDILLSGN